MGRKPNPVLLAHFRRGEKREDSTNRYEFTCKACGEYFEKGRPEVLLAHITKQCMGVFREQGEHLEQATTRPVDYQNVLEAHAVTDSRDQHQRFKLTGLEALAEASRRVGHAGKLGSDNVIIDPSLQDYEKVIENQIAASLGYIPGCVTAAQRLSSIAASASNLECSIPHQGQTDGTFDSPDFGSISRSTTVQTQWPIVFDYQDPFSDATGPGSVPQITSLYESGGVGPLRTKSGNGETSPRIQKVRGKLTDPLRRQKISEIRKRGACIRCRMLRKPCSDGDPCDTCASVEVARNWKIDCLRIKMSKCFEGYSAGAFETIATRNVKAIAKNYILEEEPVLISFRYRNDRINSIQLLGHAASPILRPDQEIFDVGIKYILSRSETDDKIWAKLDSFMSRSAEQIHDDEPYEVVTSSLKLAAELKDDEEDGLISQALNLWQLTHLLTSPAELWTFSIIPSSSTANTSGPSDAQAPDPDMFSVLHSQLLALACSQASNYFASLTNDLENLLTRRTTPYRFSHFLATFLLLSSLERLDAWTHTFPHSQFREKDPDLDSHLWLLPQPPSHYQAQAAIFASLISSLVKVRGMSPKTFVSADGALLLKPPRTGQNNEEIAVRWFESLQMTLPFLKDRRDAVYSPDDFRSLEMKFTAPLLLA